MGRKKKTPRNPSRRSQRNTLKSTRLTYPGEDETDNELEIVVLGSENMCNRKSLDVEIKEALLDCEENVFHEECVEETQEQVDEDQISEGLMLTLESIYEICINNLLFVSSFWTSKHTAVADLWSSLSLPPSPPSFTHSLQADADDSFVSPSSLDFSVPSAATADKLLLEIVKDNL